LMLGYASARVMRIESLFVGAAVILLAPVIASRWPRRPARGLSVGVVRAVAVVFLVSALGASTVLARFATSCIPIWGPWVPDLQAARALKSAGPGRLVTSFDWGQYAIWHLSPQLRVSIDGRRETVYSDARLAEYDSIVSGTPEGLAVLEQWNAEYVWLPVTSQATFDWLEDHGYRLDIRTSSSRIAVRADLPQLPAGEINQHVPPCFPG
jgi:hypothetical protein